MAQRTIFYSWQSDLPNNTNRGFIENCLKKAIKSLHRDRPYLDVCLDRDTADVAGSPDIAATILDKIDNCSVFVCDVSIVQKGDRDIPNPNVLFELGYAVKKLSWSRVICIANLHYGEIERLPFDVRQRRVKSYTLSSESTDRELISKSLTSVLRNEIEAVISESQEGENLQLKFGDIDTKTPIGTTLEHNATYYSFDPETEGPLVEYFRHYSDDSHLTFRLKENPDFDRQLVKFIQHKAMLRKIGFVVYNGSQAVVTDLTMQLQIGKTKGLVVLDDEPIAPAKSAANQFARDITPISDYFDRPGKVIVNELPDKYEIEVKFGKVQPQANAWSDPVYIGTVGSWKTRVTASLFADELITPVKYDFDFVFQIMETSMVNLPGEIREEVMHSIL